MFEYIVFNKPFRVQCQFSPIDGKKTLADYLEDISDQTYPLGRLDYESEGLLLLTNDKSMHQKLMDPKAEKMKTYWVQVEGAMTEEALKKLRKGVTFRIKGESFTSRPAIANALPDTIRIPERSVPIRYRKDIPTSWIELGIMEGKNRQVRHMTAAVGFPTLRLIRHRIGGLSIEGLDPGDYRSITKKEWEWALL